MSGLGLRQVSTINKNRKPVFENYAVLAQLARVPAFQVGCRGFKSHKPLLLYGLEDKQQSRPPVTREIAGSAPV